MGSTGIRQSGLTDAILAYTAQGGQYASKYPFSSEMNRQLLEATSNNEITLSQDIYRKIDVSESKRDEIFNSLLDSNNWDFDSNTLQSFTKERTRAFSYGGSQQQYILLRIPAGTKVNGLDIASKSLYPQEQEILLGKNKLSGSYDDLQWTSSGNMIITLRRRR